MSARIPNITKKRALEAVANFAEKIDRSEYQPFIGNYPVAIYYFDDDMLSAQFASYACNLFLPNWPKPNEIKLKEKDGNIKTDDVKGKKVIIISNKYKEKYAEFIGRRFSDISEEGCISLDDVLYVTARPYKKRKIKEFYDIDKKASKKSFFDNMSSFLAY